MNVDLVQEAQSFLRRRICGNEATENVDKYFESEVNDLYLLLKRTVEFGEGNSMLVIGQKGCGKTTIVNIVLQKLRRLKEYEKNVFEVHLSGLLQTNDRIALQEITRQLQLENTLGDKVFGSFADTLAFLLCALKSGSSSQSSPVLFFLDNFDLFALHRHQTLLYNLLDISQQSTTPIAVIGVTCRYDVMDLLEKRVKSRFSHRQVFVTNNWSFDEYLSAFIDMLRLKEGFTAICNIKTRRKFVSEWNQQTSELFENIEVRTELQNVFSVSKLPSVISLMLTKPICQITDGCVEPQAVIKSAKHFLEDSKESVLLGLSVLELCLVIAMLHLFNTYNGEPFNFQMTFNEYLKFAQRKSSVLQNHTKQVVMKAFERLIELELIQPHETSSVFGELTSRSNLQKEYRLINLAVDQDQLHSAIHKYQGCPTDVKQWAASALPS